MVQLFFYAILLYTMHPRIQEMGIGYMQLLHPSTAGTQYLRILAFTGMLEPIPCRWLRDHSMLDIKFNQDLIKDTSIY